MSWIGWFWLTVALLGLTIAWLAHMDDWGGR